MTLLGRQPGWVTLACVVCLTLAGIGFIPLGLPARIRRDYGVAIPESRFQYTRENLARFVKTLGPDGVAMYLRQLSWDFVLAFAVAGCLFPILDAWWVGSLAEHVWWRQLVWLPMAYLAFDLAEDLYLRMLAHDLCAGRSPAKLSYVLAGVFTAAKFLSLAASLLLAVVGGVLIVLNGPGGTNLDWWVR